MRVPLSWLGEYVDLPGDATPESVMAELVKIGLEEEGAHRFELSGPIVVGQVLEFAEEPQSNGKTIRWCQVRVAPEGQKAADGGEDVRGIVCGASNFLVGDKVVVCLPGAVLPGDFKIAARSTYGHISDGMMASARELTISDAHEGILRLQELGLDPKVGSDAFEILYLNETAAEVNVTPDRGYCFSIRGIAREYAHATGSAFRDPKSNAFINPATGFELEVVDDAPIRGNAGTKRFVARVVNNVDPTRPTPPWMIARLKMAGMRSISIVVDITNYVMLELGQPTHAYDLDKLTGGIIVRRAKAGETLKTLDGQTRKLHPEDLLITDGSGPIGLAGVMGGESTEVSNSTKNVLVEAACFEPITIARSARRHKLPSEASKRFERGVDPMMADNAAARVVQLLEVHALGAGSGEGAEYREPHEPESIWLPSEFAQTFVGVDYTQDEIQRILLEIGCSIATVDGGYQVIAPTWRPDITHKTDLVEEIARIAGYDRIPSRLPVAPPGRGLTKRQHMRRTVINSLAAAGHTEVLTYPFIGTAANQWFTNGDSIEVVKLANALQEDANEMRTSMLPGLLEAAKRNLSRGLVDLAIFEEGSVFLPTKKIGKSNLVPIGNQLPSSKDLAGLMDTIPAQPRHLAAIFTGNRKPQQVNSSSVIADYQDAIHVARISARAVGLDIVLKQGAPKGFHPGRTAQLFVQAHDELVPIGFAGELDPKLATENDLPRRVAAVEIDLEALYAAAPNVQTSGVIGAMPAATQDLSLVLPISAAAADVQASIIEGAGELLENIVLVDDYRGSNLPDGQKSLTFALRFRAEDRTLTQAEASAARDQAVALANQRFGATLRA